MNYNDLHFEKAPIVEAIIALDVAPALDDGLMAKLVSALETIKGDYPDSEPLRKVQFQIGFQIGPNAEHLASQPPPSQDELFGRKHVSADKRQLAVFRRDGFSFSRLPPYERWQTFRDEAKRLWKVYKDVASEQRITRWGLRYINRVDIPIKKPVEDFLTIYPELPPNADGSLRSINSSYMRVDGIVEEIPNGRLIIQQASLPAGRADFARLSLDFDISVAPLSEMSEESVWKSLETARTVKNKLFVASLKKDFLETFR